MKIISEYSNICITGCEIEYVYQCSSDYNLHYDCSNHILHNNVSVQNRFHNLKLNGKWIYKVSEGHFGATLERKNFNIQKILIKKFWNFRFFNVACSILLKFESTIWFNLSFFMNFEKLNTF